jgi:hypothetical protein
MASIGQPSISGRCFRFERVPEVADEIEQPAAARLLLAELGKVTSDLCPQPHRTHYWITSSAVAKSASGMVRASAPDRSARADERISCTFRAGISYALTEAMDDGHCGLPRDELLPLAEGLLEVPVELVRTALDLELADGTVVADTVEETACVFLAGLHRAERNIADRLLGLSGGSLPWPWIDPDKALPWVAERLTLTFADSQTDAIRQALACKALVITGGPGVGKTTIVKAKRRSRKPQWRASSNWSRQGYRGASGSTLSATSRFSAQ